MPADPTMLYSPGDFTATRKRIFEDSLDAVKKRFPIENTRYSLSLENVSYDNPREFTLKDQKRAVQNDQSLSWRIKGNWVLRDKNTGNVVSTSSRRAIMDIPYLTERGTFIRNGTEMTLPLQMRLVPGVYSRFGEDGLAKAHINARQGTGNTVMMTLNPAKPIFRVSVGTRNYDLFPLLKHNGVSDEEIKAAWGEQLFKANEDAFVNGGGWYRAKTAADNPDPNDPWEKASKDVLGGELDVNNTEATFGTPYDRVDPKLLLATSARLIGLAKGTASGDNRDSMENQRFFGPSDYIAERIRLDAGGLARNLLWRVSRYGDAEKIPSSPLSKYVHGLFTESNLSQAIEETNLLDAYKRATMVTRMGEGGIGSLESAPMSARLVHNTYKGFIDPVSSPECHSIAHMVYTKNGWKPITDITTDDLVACMIEGRLEYHHPEQVVSYDFDGQLYCYKNTTVSYEVTGNHRMWCKRMPCPQKIKKSGHIQKAYNPDYAFEFAEDMHNTNRILQSSNHLPLKHDIITTKTITSDEDSYTFGIKDWCAFLGWYISEGNISHTDKYHRSLTITQVEGVNPDNWKEILDLLTRMGLTFRFNDRRFVIRSRALWNELQPLGYCDDKYIPEEVFLAPEEAQRAFIDTLLKGDGRKEGNNMPVLCTTSKRLADDYEKLLFNFGYSVSIKFEKDERLPQYLGCYTVRVLKGKEIWLWKNGHKLSHSNTRSNYYFRKDYKGKVYCLTVPGGLFYTKIDGYHAFWTGNSLRVGLDTQIAHSARRGKDGLVYAPLVDASTGKIEYLSSLESSKVPVSFPEYRDSKDFLIPAMVGNTIQYLPKSDVKYFVPNGDSLFSTACDFVPIKSGIKAGRLLMAQKHQTQAMSIKDRMAPYVQSLDPDGSGKSMEEVNSHIMGAVKAGLGGKVVRVTKDDITVLQTDGKRRSYSLYDNYPLNRKSVVNNTAQVKVGDIVEPGQLLASSSYTDDKGVSALGTQLRSGWLSYKGWNYLDAIVVSESAAKKLTSEHFYHEGIDREEGTDIGKDRYVAAFPSKFNRDQLATIDVNGAVKPGTLVQKGDPLVLATSLRPGGPGTGYRATHKDVSSVWEHEFPGEVTDVVDGKDGMRVYVKSWVPLQVGDKMATRFANKGTCAAVVPDEKMPRGADGRPLEILFSPTGIVSRVNSSALIEAALGKVAEKTGKRYILPGFGTDLVAFAQKELADAGLTDREDVTDPDTGRVIKGVFTGNSYVTKFHHTSESKGGARSTGTYTADEQPASGGHDGAKTLGGLVLGAFAAHGASEVLKDMKLIKGQKNTDFWRDFKMGRTPTMPGTPLIYKKFLAALEASGVHVTHDGDKTNIFAMTNSDVSKLARSEINSAATYDDKKFLPIKGGLFDPDIFGQNGDQWAKMKLDEPILNPIMDDVVCNFLNLKKADLDAVLAGEMKLPNGLTGGEGLRKQLGAIRLDNLIENAKHTIRSGPPSRRDKAIKTLRWASAMQNNDVTPDQFMLDEVPVLPPRYRRITRSGDLNMIADANYLYKELIDARDDLRKAKEAGLPDELLGYGRKRISDAFRAVTGLADPQDRKLQESGVNGLLKWVFGKGSPKCHDSNTDILTENGWTPFKYYYNSKVKVATINPDTLETEFQNPTEIIHDPYYGDLIWIHNDEIDMCVTHNHNLLIKGEKNWELHRAFTLRLQPDKDKKLTFMIFDKDNFPKEVEVSLHDVETVPYSGDVHCVTVPNGLIVTRRNGKISVGGNSGGLQRLVIGGKLDVAGRSVIDVDPRLNLDEIGMPEKQAWGLYRDFIIRKLVQGGMSPLQATKSVVDRTSLAKDALLKVLSERPVIATRAPALHKFSVQAFKPKLIPGDVLMLNSVVGKGYNSDSDGDTMTYYVPVSDKAVKEAYRLMMPSANQLSARDFTAMPEMQEELVSGAFLASHKKNTPPKKIFDTRAEAMAAYRRGEIDVDDNVVIRSEQ